MKPSPLSSCNIAIRADSTVHMGSGHVIRCLALALKMRDSGALITFLVHKLLDSQRKLIEKYGCFSIISLPTMNALPNRKFDLLVVDHYGLDALWEGEARGFASILLAVDDLALREHNCDILLDQNYYPRQQKYFELVPKHCLKLLGTQYALLREGFARTRVINRKVKDRIKNIICIMGSTDPSNELVKTISAVTELSLDDVQVHAITSSSNPHLKALLDLASQYPSVQLSIDVTDIEKLMANSDLALVAAGSVIWETLCMGVPTVAISVSDDQTDVALALSEEGTLIYLGEKETVDKRKIQEGLLGVWDCNVRQRLVKKGQELVDGSGACRVVKIIEDYFTRTENFPELERSSVKLAPMG